MKNRIVTCLLVIGACLCSKASLFAHSRTPVSAIAKSHSHPELTIYYTPRATVDGGAGSWQLMVLGPHGKLYKDRKNGKIDMQTPPTEPLVFKIHKHLKPGRYSVIIYVTKRTNNIPVDITTLAMNMLIEPSNGLGIESIPVRHFVGNNASTIANDTAQAIYTLVVP